MQVEKAAGCEHENGQALYSPETVKQIYARVFRAMKPRTPVPEIIVRFRKYANANSRIRLQDGHLTVDISDLLESAPGPVQEALALILLGKLFRRNPDGSTLSRYRRYLNRAEVRRTLETIKKQRGRKIVLEPSGEAYNLCHIFEELNLQYFHGLMARPRLGWSVRASRSVLGHYDPSHHTIVITNLLDSREVSELAVRYVLFHEMLHLRFPIQHRGAKRCVHTREFKEAEKMFVDYKKAQRELKNFVEKAARLEAKTRASRRNRLS
jgi:hypothetical protein